MNQQAAGKQSLGNIDVDAVIGRIRQELHALMQQRDETVKRIGTVKRTVVGLVTLFGTDVLDEELLSLLGFKGAERRSGLTKACRLVLMNSDKPLAAREVCDEVQRRLPAVGNHKDPLASVVTVLNRLVDYGEACTVPVQGGRHKWVWATDDTRKPAQQN